MKILLVADVPNWAWSYKADALIKHLPQYDLKKIYSHQYSPSMRKNYDEVLFFGWNEAKGELEDLLTGISSFNHRLLKPKQAAKDIPRFKAIATVSKQLYHLICESRPKESTYYCANGVDHEIFVPESKPRDKFVVGWVGRGLDPKATLSHKPYDMKGARCVLEPIRERLKEHKDVEIRIHDKTYQNGVKLTEMPSFYHGIDVLLNTSFREGTPNPGFEASACGKPLIASRVGCIPELITHGENGFIVDSYDNEEEAGQRVDDYVKHILFLKDNRDVAEKMGENNRNVVERDWTWADRAKAYIPMFEGIPNV